MVKLDHLNNHQAIENFINGTIQLGDAIIHGHRLKYENAEIKPEKPLNFLGKLWRMVFGISKEEKINYQNLEGALKLLNYKATDLLSNKEVLNNELGDDQKLKEFKENLRRLNDKIANIRAYRFDLQVSQSELFELLECNNRAQLLDTARHLEKNREDILNRPL